MASKDKDVSVKKRATLFDHLNAIKCDKPKNYWKELSVEDKKTWSNYMMLRYLSMNLDWLEIIAEYQHLIQELPPEYAYKLLSDMIPYHNGFIKYVKGSKVDTYEAWLVKLIAKHYEVSQAESEEYLQILYASKGGKDHIKEISEMYGTDPKQIKKLKLGIK